MKRLLNIFLSLCCCAAVFSQSLQEFSVVNFEEKPFDTSARDERYKTVDGNGALFSIIKLVSTTPNDDLSAYSFDFGLCESRVKQVGDEVWLYVQRNAMRVTIKRDGYKTVKHELNVTVQPGKVYEMTLQATPRTVQRQFLTFEISPADSEALITFKDANRGEEYKPFAGGKVDALGRLAMSLELGVYAYRIISTNYHTSEGVVTLSSPYGEHIEKVNLRPNFANVTLNAGDGVEIYINDEKIGTKSWTGKLSPGTYSIECRKQLHKSSLKTIVIEEGKDVTLQLMAPTPITGTLSLTSNPLGAKITIEGKTYGETPEFITGLIIGEHKVELSCPGYKSETVTVAIREDEETECGVELQPISNRQGDKSSGKTSGLVGEHVGHEYVDLGLSVKWATCNVGASKPEEYGGYYAWGEIEEKDNYDWSTYKWCKGSDGTLTKYCTNSYHGTVDNKTDLDPEDDVAHVKWGGTWRMPTLEEQKELSEKCTWTWTTQNGVKGYKVTGPNGNSIFLPAAGYRDETEVYNRGSCGDYWASSIRYMDNYSAGYLGLADGYNAWSIEYRTAGWVSTYRNLGHSVRPVCDGTSTPVAKHAVSVSSGDGGDVAIIGSSSRSIILETGVTVIVTATPNEGYTFIGWYVNDVLVSTYSKYTFTVKENITLIAKFERRKTYIDGYEYVDLGLPSGLKWATCNVGASKPEDYGGYYAWGETQEKSNYDWNTYKWCKGSYDTITKYCTTSGYGTVDNKTVLDPEDDVAHVKWGGTWRMPTLDEQKELLNNCTWTWTTQNGVNGYKITGPNGNSIFLPAAGCRIGSEVYDRGSYGNYWSSSLNGYYSNYACYLLFDSGYHDWNYYYHRYYGHSVRPVCDETSTPVAKFEREKTHINGYESVDLGLPSGLKWATCNVGASKPEDYGSYYAWGEIEEKSNYDWNTYKWCKGRNNTMTKYCTDGDYGKVDNKTVLDPEDDVAHVKWGGSWRMPTLDEQQELLNNCTWTWVTYKGVDGYKVTGPNGNSIFLPAAGYRDGTGDYDRGSRGYYWSLSRRSYYGSHDWSSGDRCSGYSVRPVCD